MIVTGDTLSFDCETTGLKESDRPFAMSVYNGTQVGYLDSRINTKEEIAAQIEQLNMANRIIAQNAKFDLRMLSHWGLNPRGTVSDTEVLGRLVRNDHFTYSLDAQTKRYGLHKDDGVAKYITKNKLFTSEISEFGTKTKLLHFDKVPMEIMRPYAEQDAIATFDLHQKLSGDLDPRSDKVWETEQALTKVCFRMERNGVLVNTHYTREAIKYEEGLVLEAKRQFLLATGKFYDNKKTTLVEVFRKAGETIPKAAKGGDSLTDDILESFTSPAAKIVQTIRHYEKRLSTYYSSFLERIDPIGVLRADMRQAGTATGRFSYREPNLQNVPKEEKSTAPFVVRGCFMPKPGNVFVSMDYKQQEYRLMLAYANHKQLIAEVMAGKDVHQATADLVGISRSNAKTLNFAILYGAGPAKIALMLGIPVHEARKLIERYFNSLMEVEKLIFDVTKKGAAVGHVYNWAGRKLHITSREFAYALPNHLIQGGGADICKIAMVECAKIIPNTPVTMVLQIHDAIVFEMPKESIPRYAPVLRQIMIDAFPAKNGMLMDVDIAIGEKSLAERDMVKWKEEA